MTKLEHRRLKALVKKFVKESNRLQKKSSKIYRTAGYSDSAEGTGDEGWQLAFRVAGESFGYLSAAVQLDILLENMKVKND